MKSILKLSAFLTLAITLIGLSLAQITPVAAAAGPVHPAKPPIPLPSASLPVAILAALVCIIFAAIALFPLISNNRTNHRL